MDILAAIESQRLSKTSGIMQYPNELQSFMEFVVDHGVKSYLEIGVKSGHLVMFMQEVLGLEKVYACDIKYPKRFEGAKPDITFFLGSSDSKAYLKWRENIGHIDMVMIDADHRYGPAKRDYLREAALPHRFLAMHDIANPGYPHLTKLWKKTVKGDKVKFVNDDPSARLLNTERKDDAYIARYKKNYGTSCGIGVCWKNG